MRGLNAAESQFSADDGAADPVAAAALTAYAAGQCSEYSVLTALARSRLLVPVVAVLTEAEETPAGDPVPAGDPAPAGEQAPAGDQAAGDGRAGPGQAAGLRQEKSTEMALPTLIGRDGRAAVIAFTSLDALTRWRPEARPVPVPAASVWLAGIQDASAVVIDVAGPVPVAVDGARLAALAAGRAVPMPHQDPDVLAALRSVLADEPLIAQAALTTPDQRIVDGAEHDDAGTPAPATADLALQVTLASDCDQAAATAAGQRIVTALLAATGGRLRRGVEVSVLQPGRRAGRA
jgi:hypothetical protein